MSSSSSGSTMFASLGSSIVEVILVGAASIRHKGASNTNFVPQGGAN